jgi:hypothetical protein
MSGISLFRHRKNDERSFDSICTECYQTIGNRETEEDLEQDEKAHVCHGRPLYGLIPFDIDPP